MNFKDLARVEIGGRTICLDTSGDVSYISHAHSDHVSGKRKGEVVASEPTLSISGVSYSSRLVHESIRLHKAGHMLGATQIEIIRDGGNFVYTGDFSIADGFTYKGADIIEADELLIESTYGSPEYHFPKKEDIAEQLRREVLSRLKYGNVIFAVYAKGKSQELIKMLNEFCGITPIVGPEVAHVSEIYVRHGQHLSFVGSHSEDASDMFRDNFVGIIPKSQFRPELRMRLMQHYRKPCYFGSLSGWNVKFASDVYDIALPLSDHADFNDLVEYVDHSSPKKVYVFGAFAEGLAGALRLRGYNSVAVR
ncbi:MAG: MBL fold metallo-hydrolase [Candidatus Micrarchaeota archaeon]|nr:MBL fold metallo-hydrolase [Candidatus Micrarchaeota archaeon]